MDFNLQEIQGLEANLALLKRKQQKLQRELILAKGTDASKEFRLEEELPLIEADIHKLQKQRAQLLDFHTEVGKSLLESKIKDLKIDKILGEVDFVNCNRQNEEETFWEEFENLINLPFHYYFISSCQTQMPPSFSERMVYELILNDLDENNHAIFMQ